MSYLLDTNACIPLLEAGESNVRARFDVARGEGRIYVSSIVIFELSYGVWKSSLQAPNHERLMRFLSGVEVLEFSAEDATVAGAIRAALERTGRMIGPYDTLIAGQALARGMTLVTANVREFARVKDLKWEDWAK